MKTWTASLMAGCVMLMSAAPAIAFSTRLNRYVASLNTPAARQQLGIIRAVRPPRSANRLDVTFADPVPAGKRERVLRTIAREFLAEVFRWRRLPSAIVVEIGPSGRALNRVITSISRAPARAPLICD